MTDLVSRLPEAIAETERIAASNAVNLWPGETLAKVARDETHYVWQPHDVSPQRIAHILHNSPAVVLRRCAADRRRLERHAPREPGIGHFGSSRFKGTDTQICSHCSHDGDWGAVVFPCPDFLDLMDSYGLSDHQEDPE